MPEDWYPESVDPSESRRCRSEDACIPMAWMSKCMLRLFFARKYLNRSWKVAWSPAFWPATPLQKPMIERDDYKYICYIITWSTDLLVTNFCLVLDRLCERAQPRVRITHSVGSIHSKTMSYTWYILICCFLTFWVSVGISGEKETFTSLCAVVLWRRRGGGNNYCWRRHNLFRMAMTRRGCGMQRQCTRCHLLYKYNTK